jgi:hypothetical protein
VFAHLPEDGSAANPKALNYWHQSTPRHRNQPQPEAPADWHAGEMAIPDSQLASSLFQHFFSTMWQVLPYLERSSLMLSYQQALTDDFKNTRRITMAIFNIIRAHGAYCISYDQAEHFYRRAIGPLNSLLIRDANEEMGTALSRLQQCQY